MFTRPGALADAATSTPKAVLNGCMDSDFDRDGLQLAGLVLGKGVAGEHSRRDLRPGEVLQLVPRSVRRIELRVRMPLRVGALVGGRLIPRHEIGERPLPETVVLRKRRLQR